MGKRYIILDDLQDGINKGTIIQGNSDIKVFKSKLDLAQFILRQGVKKKILQ